VNVGRKRGDCREWHRGMGGKGTREACPSLVATASGVSADQSGTGTRACLLKAVIMIFPVPQRLRVGRLSVPDVILPSPHARRQYSLPISSSQSFVLSSSLTRSLAPRRHRPMPACRAPPPRSPALARGARHAPWRFHTTARLRLGVCLRDGIGTVNRACEILRVTVA
jgi:hypothetical protein